MTYPLTLYRDGSAFMWDGRACDALVVNDEAEDEAARKDGWSPAPAFLGRDPLDHDRDGKPGGSIAPADTDDLASLRAEYKDKMGKRPFPGWGADELRKRMAG